MGVGSIPDSPPMPAGDTAEERERAWAAAHPPTAQGQPKPQAQPQQYQPAQQTYSAAPVYGGQGLYPQPVAGIPVRGEIPFYHWLSSSTSAFTAKAPWLTAYQSLIPCLLADVN